MNEPNTIVRLDPQNLKRRLATLQPMQLCAYSVKLTNVPAEMSNVTLAVFKADGTHFAPCPCTQDANGDWQCDIIGGFFPLAGEGKYQIAMTDALGRRYAGGKGLVTVEPFDEVGGGEITPQGDVVLTEIPDEQGNAHKIVAVKVDGEWTWRMAD